MVKHIEKPSPYLSLFHRIVEAYAMESKHTVQFHDDYRRMKIDTNEKQAENGIKKNGKL